MKMHPLVFSLLVFALTILVALASIFIYLFFQFEKVDISDGEYLGLSIGDTKQVAYGKIAPAFVRMNPSDPRVFFEIEVDNETSSAIGMEVGRHAMVQSSLNDDGFGFFKSSDLWKFYVGASYMNSLTLEFCNDHLCRVTRMRKPFEMP